MSGNCEAVEAKRKAAKAGPRSGVSPQGSGRITHEFVSDIVRRQPGGKKGPMGATKTAVSLLAKLSRTLTVGKMHRAIAENPWMYSPPCRSGIVNEECVADVVHDFIVMAANAARDAGSVRISVAHVRKVIHLDADFKVLFAE